MVRKYITKRFKLSVIVLLGMILIYTSEYCLADGMIKIGTGGVVIENQSFKYAISENGRNLSFIDKANGKDYIDGTTVSYCAFINRDGKDLPVSNVSLKDNLLILDFNEAKVKSKILVKKTDDQVSLEVVEFIGEAESLTFLNVPLKLKGMPEEPFAACALSMNLFTHVRQLPALQTHLWATCYNRFGMKGAKITLLGVPMKNILPAIRNVMSLAKDIPPSTAGGAWAQLSKEGYGSYLFNYGSLTEETVDEWIEKCSKVGFNQIDNHGGGVDFFKFGSFELNPEKWPEGWNHFKKINKRLHDAGISSIFHTYAFFIDKKSKYATPVPSKDLDFLSSFTLAGAVGSGDSVIVVKESTENISTITGFFVQNSRTLRLGNELIEFNGVTKSPPYQFTGCKRAFNGTKATVHRTDEKVFHLKEMFGLFVPGPETALFNEIARNTAEIVNECNFDGIYLDAIDGSGILAGDENFWYYSTKFVFEIAKHLNRSVGMETSAMEHHFWHYRSRWQAWDAPHRGFKRYIDLHSKAINGGLLLPFQLGWWLNFTWDPPQTEPTFSDDIEYLGCKMIGYNAGLALLGGLEKKDLDEKPSFTRLNALIKHYEELRHKNYFNDSVRSLLRQPGKEFTLFRTEDDKWNFKPISYQKHKVTGINQPSSRWVVKNEFDKQPVKLRIEALLSLKPFNNPDNVVLTDFSAPNELLEIGAAKGVTGSIKSATDTTEHGQKCGTFSALSKGDLPQKGSWICMEKKFEPGLNLSKNQGIGVWIKGDGNGQLLNFRIEGPPHLSYGTRGDHFVKIDFNGWRYYELVEIESSEYSNYIWSDVDDGISGAYKSHFFTLNFNNIDKLQLWYNNLPAGKEVSCMVGPVKAIPTVSGSVENPSITIGGEKIVFPVKMESGMYLELLSEKNCKLYGSKGEFIQDVPIQGSVPELKNGDNVVMFSSDTSGQTKQRVQVTVISEGKPLLNNTIK